MLVNLEDRFFYRLVKVLHYFSHGIFFLVGIVILFSFFPPNDIPDNAKSYIVCDNGKISRPVSDAGMEIYSYSKELGYSDDIKAKKFCVTDSDEKVTDRVMQDILDGKLSRYTEISKNYTLKIKYQPRDWLEYLNTIWWYFLAYAIFYIAANIFRESLIYVAFGKKFDLMWAKVIINKLRVIYDASIKP